MCYFLVVDSHYFQGMPVCNSLDRSCTVVGSPSPHSPGPRPTAVMAV